MGAACGQQLGPGVESAFYCTQDDAQEGALAFDGFLHPFKLFGMGVSARFSAQRFALFGVALLEHDAGTFGCPDALGGIRKRLDEEGIHYRMIAKQLYHDREEVTVFLTKTKG